MLSLGAMSRGDHNDSNGLHPLAKHMWRQLDGLSEIDRRYVHSFLQRRLTPPMQLANQEIAIAALQKFDSARRAAATSTPGEEPPWARGTLSKPNYNAFRDAQPDRSSWPSSTLIVNAFERRWSDALAAAGLAVTPNVLARRGLRQGKPFDAEEVKVRLLEWIAQVDPARPLIQAEYVAWANRNQDSSGRRPPTLPTVAKYLGGWDAVLIELDLLERHPDVVAARRRLEDNSRAGWATAVVMDLGLETLPKPPAGRPGFEGCAEWLRWMTAPLSEEERAGLEMKEWDILRAALTVRLAGDGAHTTVPSAKGIKDKADDRSWPAAKLQAGIIDEVFSGVAPRRHGRSTTTSSSRHSPRLPPPSRTRRVGLSTSSTARRQPRKG